ncbi:unnamed protein product [Pleuronectes platessa]|uniref:Uncharacterized protein n=1 Tax=Pleuronectes platessa TaxID=8262 RepID=A0A9N7YEF3_PLEPL|nr:unnamed protein product [Pleuronectes platessa]
MFKSLTLLSRVRAAAACVRHHSSLTAELMENMDKKATWDRFYTENNSRAPTFKNFEWFFGFEAVTCADISPVAVRLMKEHVEAKAIQPQNVSSQLEFVELDCTHLLKHLGSGSVDLIIDKGTIDALLRSKEGKGKAGLVLRQCLKVLQGLGVSAPVL